MEAAVAAFEPGTAEYRVFVLMAGAMIHEAIKDNAQGGLKVMQEWLDARGVVLDAAAEVDRVCP